MALTKSQMADVILADHARWIARVAAENTFEGSRASIAHADEDRDYLRGIGLIPQNESKRKTPRRAPRLTSADNTSDCVVTTAQGDRYVIQRGNRRLNGRRKAHAVSVDTLNKLQDANAHKVTAANLAPIGNVD